MCGERGRSVLQLGRSKIDLFSGAIGTAKNEHKRPRQKKSSSKPPLPRKKCQVATPPPPKPDCTVATRADDVSTDFASNIKAPHGVFDIPMLPTPTPASVFDSYQFYDVFFKSYVDRATSPTKPIVLEGFQQFEEIMDPEMEHIWRPILCKPLIPIVYNQRRFRF